jgi:streptogramin lyase
MAFVEVIFGGSLPATIDLSKPYEGGFRIIGAPSGSNLGGSLAGARDVNGDGLGDLVIGAPGFDVGSVGGAYVVYGKHSTTPVDLGNLGAGGFRIAGSLPAGQAGSVVAGGGDVNGDGRPDVLVGATWRTPEVAQTLQTPCRGPMYIPPPDSQRTVVYAVFGGPRSGEVDLADLSSNGFEIEPSTKLDNGGFGAIANAGDINGDGRADILIGTPNGALVVFGKTSTTPVESAALGAGGIVVSGASPTRRRVGVAVSGAGDVNGDGLADFVVGAYLGMEYPVGSAEAIAHSGYVVFGRRSRAPVDLGKLGAGGFAIDGTRDHAADAVLPLGDLNGDGLADIGHLASGRYFYVIFGKRSSGPVRLYALGDDGVRIDGSIYKAGGAGNLSGGNRKLVLVSTDHAAELVPFAPTIEPPSPKLGGTLSFGGRQVLGLTQGLGSVWLLVPARVDSTSLFDGEDELVYRLDPLTNKIVGRPVKFNGPSRVIATALGSVWALVVPPHRDKPATLLRIDPKSGRILMRAKVGSKGRDIDQTVTADTISQGLGALWITYCATGSVYRIDPESGKTVASIKVGHYPQALTFAGGNVWVADREDGRVREIDPRTNRVVGSSLNVSREPGSQGRALGDIIWMGAAADGTVWFYDQNHDQVAHLDPRTRRLTFSPSTGLRGFVAVADGLALWVFGFPYVSRVRVADGMLIGSRLEYDTGHVGAVAVGGSAWTTTLDGRVVKFNMS